MSAAEFTGPIDNRRKKGDLVAIAEGLESGDVQWMVLEVQAISCWILKEVVGVRRCTVDGVGSPSLFHVGHCRKSLDSDRVRWMTL